jgi:hypothetical protein
MDNKSNVNGPFDVADRMDTSPTDLSSMDMTLEIARKEFEKEKKLIMEQRALAEEGCVMVIFYVFMSLVKTK